MRKLVKESILKGPSEEEIFNTMRKMDPDDQLRVAVAKKYKKGIVDALERGAEVTDVLRFGLISYRFSDDEIQEIIHRHTGIDYHVNTIKNYHYREVFLNPTYKIVNNILDDVVQNIYNKIGGSYSELYGKIDRNLRAFIRSKLGNDFRIIDKFKKKYDRVFVDKSYHLRIGFEFVHESLVKIKKDDIKEYILKEGTDYVHGYYHILLPLDIEKYLYVPYNTRDKLINFHKDIQEFIDNYSDVEYWAKEFIKEFFN